LVDVAGLVVSKAIYVRLVPTENDGYQRKGASFAVSKLLIGGADKASK